jgi:glycosyltransferase involved in cell wall biosynthesis
MYPVMMDACVIAFLALAAAMWLGTLGYLLALQAVALFRRPAAAAAAGQLPALAVVVPVRNEESMAGGKLRDLLAADYPADRLRIVVVDGGSDDRTVDLVNQAARADGRIALLRADHASGKAAQLNHAMERLTEEFVVVTDADARLDPACLRELVHVLLRTPDTAMVGALVSPAASMPEERAYWWFLNRLWWLEGEVLGSAMVSAACYAIRRSHCPRFPDDVHCDDAFLMSAMGAGRARVRLCLAAGATELRVPRTVAETLRFRIRRGCGYLRELRRVRPRPDSHAGWRIARAFRLFHFQVAPALASALVALGLLLLVRGEWTCVASAAGAFAAGALAYLGPPRTSPPPRSFAGWPRRTAAGIGAALLTWISLVRIGWCTATGRNGGMPS